MEEGKRQNVTPRICKSEMNQIFVELQVPDTEVTVGQSMGGSPYKGC